MPIGEPAYYPDEEERRYDQVRADSHLFSKYEVISVIGKGSFSQVLRVQHKLTRQFYAVKMVVSSNTDINAVNNELSILSRVNHPFVIRLEEVQSD